MADDREKPQRTAEKSVEAPQSETKAPPRETENPGEGEFMFSDWALI